MSNIVNSEENDKFDWKFIGDINFGRPTLGEYTSVAIYRLMLYSIRNILIAKFGKEESEKIILEAGKAAGYAFFDNILSEYKHLNINDFLAQLERFLISFRVCILKLDKIDLNNSFFTLSVKEDIDCSGLQNFGETVCAFNEGFIAAIFSAYMGKNFIAKEIECWCNGDRVCKFEISLK